MYQGARNVYCRYPATKEVEMVYDLGARHLLFLDAGLTFPARSYGRILTASPTHCMLPRNTSEPRPFENMR